MRKIRAATKAALDAWRDKSSRPQELEKQAVDWSAVRCEDVWKVEDEEGNLFFTIWIRGASEERAEHLKALVEEAVAQKTDIQVEVYTRW